MTFPVVPLGDQWSGAPFLDETSMNARIDAQVNAMAVEMATWGHDFPRFRGQIVSGISQALNVNMLWQSLEDTASGYNASTGVYTVPTAGLWLLSTQVVGTNAVTWAASILGLPAGWNGPVSENANGAGAASRLPGVPVQLAAGATLSVQIQGTGAVTLAGGATDAGGKTSPRCYFNAMMVSHR